MTKYPAQAKYDKTHTKFYGIKLHLVNDADLISALDGKAVQTEIKRLMRLAIAVEKYTKGE